MSLTQEGTFLAAVLALGAGAVLSHRQLEAAGARAGSQAMRELIAIATPTRSFLEDVLIPLIKQAGLPTPETNVHIEGYEEQTVTRLRRALYRAAR